MLGIGISFNTQNALFQISLFENRRQVIYSKTVIENNYSTKPTGNRWYVAEQLLEVNPMNVTHFRPIR